MRQIHRIQAGITIIVVVALATTVVECSNGKRRRFYARSSKDLRALAQKDLDTVAQLERFKNGGEQEAWSSSFQKAADEYLRSFASSRNNNYENTNDFNVTQHLEDVVRNPLEMLQLLQRVAYFFRYASIETKAIPAVPLDDLKQQAGKDAFPFQGDLFEAAKAILRIQFIYNLRASELVSGKVRGIQTKARLLAAHCFYIGLVAKMRNEFTLAFQWLKEAAKLARIDRTADIPTVLTELVELIMTHDTPWAYQHGGDPYFFMKQLKSLRSVDHEKIPSVRDEMYRRFAGKGRNCSFWSSNIWGLCSGENFRTPQAWSRLFCWHEFKVHKVFTIGPLKMEFLSRNPDVVQIHGSFTESEMKEAGSSDDYSGLNLTITEDRITKKLDAMAGLQAPGPTTMEARKVVNHIPGGHTDVHVDSNGMTSNDSNWITTFMIYLKDVEEGGYTVFPTSFATAVPRKGSAVFWFNTFSDGTPDFSTAHSDCPVVLGERSVFYKWTSYYDQFSVRKCLLKPKERFQVLVNGKVLPVLPTFHHKRIEEEEYDNGTLLLVAEPPSPSLKVVIPRKKYGHSPSTALKSLILLDWEIFGNVKRIVDSMDSVEEPHGGNQKESFQSNHMFRTYLQDFNETAYNSVLQSDEHDAEIVSKLAWNPLAIYRTFARFENYITKWMAPQEDERGDILERMEYWRPVCGLPLLTIWKATNGSPILHSYHRLDVFAGRNMPGTCSAVDVREYLGRVYNLSDGPDESDLEEAMNAILTLQFVHDLKSDDISRGIMAGMDTGIHLSAEQCIEIGIQAIGRGRCYQAIDWMETAVHKVKSEGDATVSFEEAQMQLKTAEKVHDRLLAKFGNTQPNFYTKPVLASRSNSSLIRETVKESIYKNQTLLSEHAELQMFGICQGKVEQATTQEQSKLFCWYERKMHPYFRVGPLKAEILSMYPKAEVALYHDVLGPKLLEYFRSNDSFRDYHVSTANALAQVNPNVRISATANIPRGTSAEVAHVFRLVNLVTGLNSIYHPLRLNSYTPGGYFLAHSDTESYDSVGEHALIASFMFYITEPLKGGGTAFAQAGVHSAPKAGSALLWYNVFTGGEMDPEMYHGGCPVIFGEKRVMTLFHYYTWQDRVQCHKDPKKRIEILVNGKSKYGSSAVWQT